MARKISAGSRFAIALAVIALVLVIGSVIISHKMDRTAFTVGSSTRPKTPGSIQDQTPIPQSLPPHTTVPPAGK
jgi:hypothetical protein